ncbi:MAG: two-component regulator propeller domain-containing protein [Bacteroidota bacterium]
MKSDKNKFAYPHIRQLLFDNDSTLWVETVDGYLINFDVNNNVTNRFYKHPTVNQLYYLYHSLYRDKQGILWIGTRNQPPMYLDELNDKVVVIDADMNDFSKKRSNDMACYYEDNFGNFWITALDGIYLFDKKTEIFTKFLSTTTYDVKEDSDGSIWFATGSGVLKFDFRNNIITQMENEKDNPNSISSNSVYKIMEDKMGNLWFATNEGVNIYSAPAYAFRHYTHIPGISNSPEGFVVNAVAEDENSNLWIGYEDDGLDFFNRQTAEFTHFLHDLKKPNTLASNKVSALKLDKNNRLWIGLWRGVGFNMLNTKTLKFSLFTYNSRSLEQDWYSDFVEDDKGNFYVGFWGANGLTGFDRKSKKFLDSYKTKFERVNCSRLITKLLLDSKSSIWFGTTDCGLHRYFPDGDSAWSYFSDDTLVHGLHSNNIVDITEDKFGNIWLINDLLQKYNPENDTFVSYGYTNGLTTNELASVLADDEGMIWVGTVNKGLFKFIPQKQIFTQYSKHDGLESNSFTKARMKLKSGELFFGCTNGFNLFNPTEIVENNSIPTPYFGRLYVFDHIVSHDLDEQEMIMLEPEENVFTIELLISDMVNPERYSYQCKLDGYDEDWVEIDNTQRIVRYAAVPPGYYKLNYRVGNRTGTWSATNSSVIFVINRPYYLTWWFISTVLAVFFILLIVLIKKREYDLKQKHRNIELQQRLFRVQMNPHFMFNSLLAIQNYIYAHDKKEASNYLSDFAQLFRLILNNSRSEFILLEKEIETLKLYLNLQSLRYPDKFTYKIHIDPEIDSDFIMIPPMLAQPMIENALEHGLFYKDGKGHIDIRFIYKGSNLVLEVEDNGIGLTIAKEKSVFKSKYSSSAIDITRERIKILGKRHGFFAIFEIKELLDINENVKGTMVMFTLPYKIPDLDIENM